MVASYWPSFIGITGPLRCNETAFTTFQVPALSWCLCHQSTLLDVMNVTLSVTLQIIKNGEIGLTVSLTLFLIRVPVVALLKCLYCPPRRLQGVCVQMLCGVNIACVATCTYLQLCPLPGSPRYWALAIVILSVFYFLPQPFLCLAASLQHILQVSPLMQSEHPLRRGPQALVTPCRTLRSGVL